MEHVVSSPVIDEDDILIQLMTTACSTIASAFAIVLRRLLKRRKTSRRHGGRPGPRRKWKTRSTHWWTTVVPKMDSTRFKRAFRVSRRLYKRLLLEIRCDLQHPGANGIGMLLLMSNIII